MAIAEPRATPVLTTERLRLRPRTVEDAQALFPTLSDAELMRWWSHAPHEDIAQTRASLARTDPDWRCWAITMGEEDVAIGYVAVGEKRQRNVSEIGYLLAREQWGQGIAEEAIVAVIDQLFAEGQRRVFADTDPDNVYSRRLLERLGFQLEGVLRAEWETHIGIRDTMLYGLLKEDWTCRPRRA